MTRINFQSPNENQMYTNFKQHQQAPHIRDFDIFQKFTRYLVSQC